MTERTRTALGTVLWCVLVIAAVITLWLAAVHQNVVLTALAAVATFAVVKTHSMVPLPKVYRDRGITNDIFVSQRQRVLDKDKEKESGSAG